jgi:hypothetical protein
MLLLNKTKNLLIVKLKFYLKMKKILLATVVVLFAISANAQLKIGVNGGLGLPMGSFGDANKMGFGGGVVGKYLLNEKIALGLNIGYYSFAGKDLGLGITGEKLSIMPITALFNFYFASEGFKPYVGADLGFYSVKYKTPTIDLGGFGTIEGSSETLTKIGFAPTVGFEASLSEKVGLDVNAKYHYISTEGDATSYIGINVGLIFALGGK